MIDRSARRPLAGLLGPLAPAVLAAATILGGVAAAGAEEPAKPSDPVVIVDDIPITRGDVIYAALQYEDELRRVPDEQRMQIIINTLIDMRLLANAAEKDGLDSSEAFSQRMAFLKMQTLRDVYFDEKIDAELSEDDLKARYDSDIGSRPPQTEIKARHILVESEDEAREVVAALDDGGDFAALAGEKSIGPTKTKGGDLGFFGKGRMVPEFEEAAFALEKGAYTQEPVKTQFGWHVIKVEDQRTVEQPSFEEIKDRLRDAVLREKFAEVVDKLKDAAKIDFVTIDPQDTPQEGPEKAE